MFESMLDGNNADPAGVAGPIGTASASDLLAAVALFEAAGVDLSGVDLGLLQPARAGRSLLGWLDPARHDLGDDALIELGVMACRLEGWAGAVKARVALALGRSYRRECPVADPEVAASVAATEVGCATGHSQIQVQRWSDLAGWLERVPSANADFGSGRLGWVKAAAFRECAGDYPLEVAEAVYRTERGRTLSRTSSQMRTRWNRALAKAEPDITARQAERAHTGRGLQVFTRCQAPGMAGLVLTGPAPLILAAKARLDEVADSVRAADPLDRRTLDAIRLDAALDLLLDGHLGGDCDAGTSRRTMSRRLSVVVTVPLSVLTGASRQPAVLAGYGPIPAQMAREVAADAVWRCAVVDDDPTSPTHQALLALGRTTYTPNYVPGRQARRFITLRDGTCRFPGCQAQAATSDLDHRIPYSRGGPTCDCNVAALCRHHHRLKHEGGITARTTTRGAKGAPDTGCARDLAGADGVAGAGATRGVGTAGGSDSTGASHSDGITWSMPSGRTYTTEPEPPPF